MTITARTVLLVGLVFVDLYSFRRYLVDLADRSPDSGSDYKINPLKNGKSLVSGDSCGVQRTVQSLHEDSF